VVKFKVNSYTSIVVRTTGSRTNLLDQALFSIYGNDYSYIEIIVVVQTENDEVYDKVRNLCQDYGKLGLKVEVIRNSTQKDQRARNLNLGIEASTGRYIGFLDDDDVLYPEHVSTLVKLLEKSESTAWAYTDSVAVICTNDALGNLYYKSQKLPFQKREYSLSELWIDNFIPIHSYLIDRNRLDNKLLQFDESFTVLEDYAFLLKLASVHRPEYYPKVTCEYRLRLDGSNSNYLAEEIYGIEAFSKRGAWDAARERIEQFKQVLSSGYFSEKQDYDRMLAIALLQQFQEESQKNHNDNKQLLVFKEQATAELQQVQNTINKLQETINRLQETVRAMESSKFWKLRKMWIKFKRICRLPVND
jgi:glycosyltransferase involved in cell wall biosynthesis